MQTESTPHITAAVELRQELEQRFEACALERAFRPASYDPGRRLEYEITGVCPPHTGRAVLEIERAVGGGFAGQVYRVRLLELHADGPPVVGLEVGKRYALKILTPPSKFSRWFRDALFLIAYQAPFGAQVHPDGNRVGVLWHKLVRQAAATTFGDRCAICDTYATLYDPALRSFGEINEWVDGRIWRFEVDDQLFDRWRFKGDPPPDHNCPEYIFKKRAMQGLVELLHEMGAPELARQYEWWTLKSQPNMLKRLESDATPERGLIAIDFRAGLTLLPFLPMSPIDPWLILRGLLKGRLVQFDRPDLSRLRRYVDAHSADFTELEPAVAELEVREPAYRASMPDVTHHHLRLLFSGELRRSVRQGTATSWEHLGLVDGDHAARLARGPLIFPLLFLVSLLPVVGQRLVKLWGDPTARTHLRRCLTSVDYLGRALRGRQLETLTRWHRAERISDERLRQVRERGARFWGERFSLGWLPGRWHRYLVEPRFAWERLKDKLSFTYKFLRIASFREQWLIDEVEAGRREGMLTDEEAARVTDQIQDPFIQKYLRCLAVHLCTVPITQIVMVVVGVAVGAYFYTVRGAPWEEAVLAGTGAGALIQLLPISPGSTARGLFVLYLMIKERDWRNYYVAAPVSFIHVIGYLAFPLQMVASNPALARFMAGRWATKMVHVVPVFGEAGGLLEHTVFDLFFNLPLSIKRGFKTRPIRWIAYSLAALSLVALLVFAGFVKVWEWRQPVERLEAVMVVAVDRAPHPIAGDLGLFEPRLRVRFEGQDRDAIFMESAWDGSVRVGDTVDAQIRRSYFGDRFDGLGAGSRSLDPLPPRAP